MSELSMTQFPYLNVLMSKFDQDYDLIGDVPDVIAHHVRFSYALDAWATVADIRRFLGYHPQDTEEAFERIFKPQVIISGWNKTVPEWLLWVERLLLEHAPALPQGDDRPDWLPPAAG